MLRQAFVIEGARYGKDHPEVGRTLANLGTAHGQLGDYSRKRELLQRAPVIFY